MPLMKMVVCCREHMLNVGCVITCITTCVRILTFIPPFQSARQTAMAQTVQHVPTRLAKYIKNAKIV